jgi:GT2 family glycosyltransferase
VTADSLRPPSVLYVVPTLGRRPDYLARTLASLRQAGDVQVTVVLVAPASATDLNRLSDDDEVTLMRQTGSGMSNAINDGWRAHGDSHDFWAWLGDDDELTASSTATAVGYLQRHPNASMVYGWCEYIDDEGRTQFRVRPSALAARLLRWGPDLVPQPGSVARASAVREVGYLDESLRYAMDLDLFLRLADVGKIGYVPRLLARFRWHEGSTTVGAPEASDAEARLVRARSWVGRRRIGFATERPAMLAGRILHRTQRGLSHRR